MAHLIVENLTKSFGSLKVLKGVSFTLEKGEVLAIIGSSGSGKTTLLRCLNFLETPDGGQITVSDKPLLDGHDNDDEIRKKRLHFGLVFQSFNLFPQYTVHKNVTLALELLSQEREDWKTNKKAILDEINKTADDLLARVGLADKAQAYPCQLSGGQQQRVAIARALALSPEILCFDEPTSALDPNLTGEVLRVIRSLKSADRTMIVVTHEMDFARKVADKVIFMANGVIEEEGTAQQVFENPQSELTKAFLTGFDFDKDEE
ncbi:MAG: amino acid ABC transporter ATP-binding protein [Clostridia bacterium]|nr:amino acid ABC transporter ATP-binding protein [Clostridia bacterium]